MAENGNFTEQLRTRIEMYGEELNKKDLPALRDKYAVFHTFFKTIHKIAMKKGLVSEDQYQYEQKISEVEPPDESMFLENEKVEQISIRMAAFDNMLDFLNNYYQFSTEFLDLPRIKKLIQFTKYFRWDHFTPNTANINTRTLAEIVGKIKQSPDTISTNLLIDAHTQIEKNYKQILATLKKLAILQREKFKLIVRENVLEDMNFDEGDILNKKGEVITLIKRKFASALPGTPFYSELVDEVLQEDYTSAGDAMRKDVLAKINVSETKKETKDETDKFKEALLEALRILATSNLQLQDAANKMIENSNMLETRKVGIGERLKKWFVQLIRGSQPQKIYELEFFDSVTSTSKTEKINFDEFINEVVKKAKMLSSISNKMSTSYRRMEASDEDQLFYVLNTNLEDIGVIHRRLSALNVFFKTEMPRDERGRIRGIKIELNAIKNNMVKVNQKKHEYVALKEEIEQMKRLGINVSKT